MHEMLDLKPQYEVWCLIPNQRRWQRFGQCPGRTCARLPDYASPDSRATYGFFSGSEEVRPSRPQEDANGSLRPGA